MSAVDRLLDDLLLGLQRMTLRRELRAYCYVIEHRPLYAVDGLRVRWPRAGGAVDEHA